VEFGGDPLPGQVHDEEATQEAFVRMLHGEETRAAWNEYAQERDSPITKVYDLMKREVDFHRDDPSGAPTSYDYGRYMFDLADTLSALDGDRPADGAAAAGSPPPEHRISHDELPDDTCGGHLGRHLVKVVNFMSGIAPDIEKIGDKGKRMLWLTGTLDKLASECVLSLAQVGSAFEDAFKSYQSDLVKSIADVLQDPAGIVPFDVHSPLSHDFRRLLVNELSRSLAQLGPVGSASHPRRAPGFGEHRWWTGYRGCRAGRPRSNCWRTRTPTSWWTAAPFGRWSSCSRKDTRRTTCFANSSVP